MYSGNKPVEWFDLSRQLFLARHAACVAVKSAFLLDHLNAAAAADAADVKSANGQSAYYPFSNHQSITNWPATSCHLVCASVVAAWSGALICRRKFVSLLWPGTLAWLRFAVHAHRLWSYTVSQVLTESFQLQRALLRLRTCPFSQTVSGSFSVNAFPQARRGWAYNTCC